MQKIGMRTVKTGVGVTLCALLSPFIVQNPVNCAIASLLSMQDTVSGSLSAGIHRIQGTIFGGILGYIILSMFPANPFFCGLGVIFTIHACNILNLNKSASIASMTFIVIQLGFSDSSPAILYSLHRVIDTCVGVLIALIVNVSLARPNYIKTYYSRFEKLEEDISNYLKYKMLNKDIKFDIYEFMEDMNELELSYAKLVEEVGYQKGNININKIEHIIKLSREVNFHIQSIELLQKKLYLNEKTYEQLTTLYNEDDIIFELKEEESPVFNYHLVKTVECYKSIKEEISLYHKNNKKKK